MVSAQTVTVLFIGGEVSHRRLVFEALQGAQPVQLLGECASIDGALQRILAASHRRASRS